MDKTPIVAVACAVGDLEAVSELLSALPAGYGAAFVIVQHAGTARRDMTLAQAIAMRTSLPVSEAYDGVVPKPNQVYVIGANSILTIVEDRICVTSAAKGPLHPADTLFTSLAEARGDGAIGVVLSGGGSDGALGIRAIHEAGGATFAQYPGSARFPSMPISAIETGCVDSVCRPNEIARELTRLSLLGTPRELVARREPLVSVATA